MVTEMTNRMDGMNKETLAYFMAGLKHCIKDAGLRQNEVAVRAGTTGVTLSKYLNGRGAPSREWREKLIAVLNVDESEVVLIGKKIQNQEEHRPPLFSPSIPIGPTDYMDPDHLISAVMSFTRQYRKSDHRLRYWRSVYENLPISVVIIKDNIVTHQNLKAREWGQVPGSAPCEHCVGRGICDPGVCAIKEAMATGVATTRYKQMGGEVYKVSVIPIHLNEADYFVAVAVHVDMDAAQAVQGRIDQPRRRKEDSDHP